MMSFNDALGTTLVATRGDKAERSSLTVFGDDAGGAASTASDASLPAPYSPFYFTGKPDIPGLGRAFLMRNYRSDLGKWQTADPLGYPDGWNQMAYGFNSPHTGVDMLGASWGNLDFLAYYFIQDESRPNNIDTDVMGLTSGVYALIASQSLLDIDETLDEKARQYIRGMKVNGEPKEFGYRDYSSVNCESLCYAMGGGLITIEGTLTISLSKYDKGLVYYTWDFKNGTIRYSDEFKDPVDILNIIPPNATYLVTPTPYYSFTLQVGESIELPYGRPYSYGHTWNYSRWGDGVVKE